MCSSRHFGHFKMSCQTSPACLRWTNAVRTNHSTTKFRSHFGISSNASASSCFVTARIQGICIFSSVALYVGVFIHPTSHLFSTLLLIARLPDRHSRNVLLVCQTPPAGASHASSHGQCTQRVAAESARQWWHLLVLQLRCTAAAQRRQGAAMPPRTDGRGTAHLRPANSTPGLPPGFSGAASAGRSGHSTSDTKVDFPAGSPISCTSHWSASYKPATRPATCCLLPAQHAW